MLCFTFAVHCTQTHNTIISYKKENWDFMDKAIWFKMTDTKAPSIHSWRTLNHIFVRWTFSTTFWSTFFCWCSNLCVVIYGWSSIVIVLSGMGQVFIDCYHYVKVPLHSCCCSSVYSDQVFLYRFVYRLPVQHLVEATVVAKHFIELKWKCFRKKALILAWKSQLRETRSFTINVQLFPV